MESSDSTQNENIQEIGLPPSIKDDEQGGVLATVVGEPNQPSVSRVEVHESPENVYTPIGMKSMHEDETGLAEDRVDLPPYVNARIEVDVCDWGKPEFGFRPRKYVDLLNTFIARVEETYGGTLVISRKAKGNIVGAFEVWMVLADVEGMEIGRYVLFSKIQRRRFPTLNLLLQRVEMALGKSLRITVPSHWYDQKSKPKKTSLAPQKKRYVSRRQQRKSQTEKSKPRHCKVFIMVCSAYDGRQIVVGDGGCSLTCSVSEDSALDVQKVSLSTFTASLVA